MKVELEGIKPTFRPVKLIISIDNENELRELWHRFNLPSRIFVNEGVVDLPNSCDSYGVWRVLNNLAIETGVRVK
jgi:hypothetical protein